jgi:casein kinase II subunit alpha
MIENVDNIEDIGCGDRSNYELIKKIGKGKYGEVFEAQDVNNNKRCAIKVLKAIKVEKIEREIKILTRVSSGPNIIKLRDVLVGDNCLPALVFQYVSDYTLKEVMMDLSDNEIRLYLFKLLRALEYTHNQVVFD